MSRPLPFVEPCQPTVRAAPPRGPGWISEVKFEGYRTQAHRSGAGAGLYSRHGYSFDGRFSGLSFALRELPARTAILDGEIVAVSSKGLPAFHALHLRHAAPDSICYWAFDLLHLNGKDLRATPLRQRRDKLQALIERFGYAPKRVTNTRDDKVETRFWKDSFEKRRCLVPATAFCEPDEGKPARWHWFALKGDDERPLFAFPGIYRQWKDPIKKDGPNVDIEVYSFLTTLPNALTTTINHERSPVLLTEEEEFATWLTGTPEEAFAQIKTSDPEHMSIVQSGSEKKDLLAAA